VNRSHAELAPLRELIFSNVTALQNQVKEAIEDADVEKGDQLTYIFAEMGIGNAHVIIENRSPIIPDILIKLASIENTSNIPLSSSVASQKDFLNFWKTFLNKFSEILDPQVKHEVLQKFEPTFLQLLDVILVKIRADEETFDKLNYSNPNSEDFDDHYYNRKYFGKLITYVCEGLPAQQIYFYFQGKLQGAVEAAKTSPDELSNWSAIESLLFAISKLVHALNPNELGLLEQVITLIYGLPDRYVELRNSATEIISSMAPKLKQL